MVKKLFALASVTALTGFVCAVTAAGCSSETTTTVADDSGTGKDAKGGSSGSSGTSGDVPPDDGGGGGGTCPADTADLSSIPSKPAGIKKGACKEADITALRGAIDADPKVDIEAFLKKQNATCASCVVADDGAAWPILVKQGGKIAVLNAGGCFEAYSGKPECGDAAQKFFFCPDVACEKCEGAPDSQEFKDCSDPNGPTSKGACNPAIKTLVTACGDKDVDGYLTKCWSKDPAFPDGKYLIEGLIRGQCGSGSTGDGGATDGGK